ncbi:hypothetical protein BU116_13225 [Staphylococcus xylosus]|uniref:hypothetical protein n=1 Tax=Staphylococcus xylosus TaxID=1288 RepID=UPI000E681828|nr:hypothetical protein [Staphylococcus xylosus]RIM75437.1 hypothetical protein BU116_13225 [Staphylococcus xylosus]
MNISKKVKRGGGNLYKMSLYTTSYIPIFLLIFINNMNNVSFKEMQNTFIKNWIFWGIMIVRFIVCILALCDFLNELKNKKTKYKTN